MCGHFLARQTCTRLRQACQRHVTALSATCHLTAHRVASVVSHSANCLPEKSTVGVVPINYKWIPLKDMYLHSIQFNSIQFNSIQFKKCHFGAESRCRLLATSAGKELEARFPFAIANFSFIHGWFFHFFYKPHFPFTMTNLSMMNSISMWNMNEE
jgi:hypothetical protein